MSSRKEHLRAMLTQRAEKLPPGNSDEFVIETAASGPPIIPRHVQAKVVGAMRGQLSNIAHAAEEARAKIASGEAVIEVPADRIESSFIADRLEANDEAHRVLVESIRENGQQVPILLRPHPTKSDWYQVAYGHRRVRALAELGRPVKAVIRPLSDSELVVAQGQENSARTDLTYIERARFAVALEDRGFERPIIMSALTMEKTQLSRLIALGRAVPEELLTAIGPAPKAGRPRWVALAERLQALKIQRAWQDLLGDPEFKASDSDERFIRVFAAVAPKSSATKPKTAVIKRDDGRRVATIERSKDRITVIINARDEAAFAEFVAEQIPALYRAFEQHQKGEG